MRDHNLIIKWSVSKGRDTYGYNICTLWDGDKRYKTCGGGYDMLGTVFANWLATNYLDLIIEKVKPYDEEGNGMYGLFRRDERYWMDGACGFDSIKRIAEEAGFCVERVYGKKELVAIIMRKGNGLAQVF